MSDIASDAPARSSRLFSSFSVRDAGTLIGLALIMAVFTLLVPGFLSERNLINILQQSSINACLALGMTLVIISGGIDLSVGPTAAIAAVISATLLVAGYPVPVAILAGLGIGVLCGLVNGVLVAYVGLQPFIVTLGTLSTYRAIALIYTGGNPVLGIPTEFRAIFTGSLAGIPSSVIIVAAVALAAWVLLKKTPIGEYLLAVGGNEEAAYVSGVPIALTKVTAYVISGASLMGGKGSIIGTILGAIILGAMRNGLTLMNVQAFYQLLATGLIILVAMMIDRMTRGRG
ncbi:ABC transporter permease [Sinorhizobium medicae]|uniref:ABC transporter permease n=1 Tax=Sinorhizobium medicae TaxID=110321 RepID=UPI00037CFA12|nr:ABC transporter permease [Sinorhizobium medicae]